MPTHTLGSGRCNDLADPPSCLRRGQPLLRALGVTKKNGLTNLIWALMSLLHLIRLRQPLLQIAANLCNSALQPIDPGTRRRLARFALNEDVPRLPPVHCLHRTNLGHSMRPNSVMKQQEIKCCFPVISSIQGLANDCQQCPIEPLYCSLGLGVSHCTTLNLDFERFKQGMCHSIPELCAIVTAHYLRRNPPGTN